MHRFDVNRLPLDGAGGLIEALATVPDPRHRRGVRHPVRGLLVVAVAAVLAGAHGFQAIAECAAELAPDVLRHLGIPRGTPPRSSVFGSRCNASMAMASTACSVRGWCASRS